MKKLLRSMALGIAALAPGLAGCSGDLHPSYSASVKYGLRTDPIMRPGQEKLLGDERYEPDRPGVFPVMKIADMEDPQHPYHANIKKIDDKVLRDPGMIPQKERQELEQALEAMFGTPANPTVNAELAGIGANIIADLKLDAETLKKGSTRYRIHCLHCHGVPGNGRGPTARWINPHPRDFRQGLFKFQSVDQTQKSGLPPSRADLLRTLRHGIEGTAMPTFSLLEDHELEALVSYVIHLSMRGSTEYTIMHGGFEFLREKNVLKWDADGDVKSNVKERATAAAKRWHKSNSPASAIDVKKYPYDDNDVAVLTESVQRGQELFTALPSPKTIKSLADRLVPALRQNAKDAALAPKIADAEKKKRDAAKKKDPKISDDDLEKIILSKEEHAAIQLTKEELAGIEKSVNKQADESALSKLKAGNCVSCHNNFGRQALYRFDQWGTLVRPNNLPLGQLRGGKRPVDVYYRIHSGINGSGMTPFGDAFRGNEQYIWDLVNFVTVLPYPAMRERLGIRIN
ncbi:MAG: cytochrome c [Planctomycetes bacterium]|nr:cytochrome c [Planctomycetota bacterium]